MKSSIKAGLSPVEARNVEEEYLGSPSLRKRLVELLRTKQEQSYNERISKTTYESPNWALVQADGVGYERGIKELISLLSEKSVTF